MVIHLESVCFLVGLIKEELINGLVNDLFRTWDCSRKPYMGKIILDYSF